MTITSEVAKESFKARDDFASALRELLESFVTDEVTLDDLKPVAEGLITAGWVDLS